MTDKKDLSSIAFVCSFGFKLSKASVCFCPLSSIVFICFSKAFPKGEQISFSCSIICCWLDGNISAPVRHSYLWILPDDKADILAASQLTSYCSFSFLIWSLIVTTFYYMCSKRFFLNLEELSNASVVSLTKKEYGQQYILYRY